MIFIIAPPLLMSFTIAHLDIIIMLSTGQNLYLRNEMDNEMRIIFT